MTKKTLKKKFSRIINLAGLVKGIFGTIGGTFVATDHKWIGLGVLLTGALADQIMIFLKKEQEDEDNDKPVDGGTPL